MDKSAEERILTGLFLCSTAENELLQNLKPDWNELVSVSVEEKLKMLNLHIADLFPFLDQLSDGMKAAAFCASHFTQPDLFLRIRPGNHEKVLNKLTAAGIEYEKIGGDCIALANNTKVDEVLMLNKEVMVQDYSSQRVASLLYSATPFNSAVPSDSASTFDSAQGELQTLRLRSGSSQQSETTIRVWDCCAASGGKSIMVKDILGTIDLTVSDVRESILFNLKKRFAEAGIKNYKSFVADLTTKNYQLPAAGYQLIIADVPCSGSGTWGRTPEQMRYFESAFIDSYSRLQQTITSAVVPYLQQNGFLLYITCSVYKKENEEVVQYLQNRFSLKIIEQRLLKGYHDKADTMFAALLQKQ